MPEGRLIELLTPAGAAAAAVVVPVAKEAWSPAGSAGKVLAGLLLSARVWRVGRAVVVPSVTPVCAKNVPMAVRGVERRPGGCSDGGSWSVVVGAAAALLRVPVAEIVSTARTAHSDGAPRFTITDGEHPYVRSVRGA